MIRSRAPDRVRQMIDERAHAAHAALAGTRPDAADALARLIREVTSDD
ncbi:hypothetical protein ACFQY7_07815 [Actinomadura luteofluorescens]